jgi:hypothetical protein
MADKQTSGTKQAYFTPIKITTYCKIAKIFAGIIFLAGIIVVIGWLLDIEVLKSILPYWVTMKFTTAISFILSG